MSIHNNHKSKDVRDVETNYSFCGPDVVHDKRLVEYWPEASYYKFYDSVFINGKSDIV